MKGFCLLLPFPFPASKKLFSWNISLQAEMRIVLCYLMAFHCNPMAFNPYHPNPEKIDDFDIAGSLGHK